MFDCCQAVAVHSVLVKILPIGCLGLPATPWNMASCASVLLSVVAEGSIWHCEPTLRRRGANAQTKASALWSLVACACLAPLILQDG